MSLLAVNVAENAGRGEALLEGCGVAILWMSHSTAAAGGPGGFPPAAMVMIGALGLGLLLLVPIGYGVLQARDAAAGERR